MRERERERERGVLRSNGVTLGDEASGQLEFKSSGKDIVYALNE